MNINTTVSDKTEWVDLWSHEELTWSHIQLYENYLASSCGTNPPDNTVFNSVPPFSPVSSFSVINHLVPLSDQFVLCSNDLFFS